jgi:hypothetical protein
MRWASLVRLSFRSMTCALNGCLFQTIRAAHATREADVNHQQSEQPTYRVQGQNYSPKGMQGVP